MSLLDTHSCLIYLFRGKTATPETETDKVINPMTLTPETETDKVINPMTSTPETETDKAINPMTSTETETEMQAVIISSDDASNENVEKRASNQKGNFLLKNL